MSGAGAFVNAARSVLVLGRNPEDPKGEQGNERVLVHVSSNWGRYAPTLGFRVDGQAVDLDDGSREEVGHLIATGEVDIGVEDLQRRDENSGADVEEAVAAALEAAERPSREVKAEVKQELGCSTRTIERAAVRMHSRGELLITSEGWPRTTKWALKGSDSTSHSSDIVSSSIATPTDTQHVATYSSGIVTRGSAPSSDTVDSPQNDGGTAMVMPIRFRCSCADGGVKPLSDGRCSRCFGELRKSA